MQRLWLQTYSTTGCLPLRKAQVTSPLQAQEQDGGADGHADGAGQA